eukprot:2047747-Amphidinium_carterae.1
MLATRAQRKRPSTRKERRRHNRLDIDFLYAFLKSSGAQHCPVSDFPPPSLVLTPDYRLCISSPRGVACRSADRRAPPKAPAHLKRVNALSQKEPGRLRENKPHTHTHTHAHTRTSSSARLPLKSGSRENVGMNTRSPI